MKLKSMLSATLAIALSSALFADDDAAKKSGKKPNKDRFARYDTNNDGKVSLEEFKAGVNKARKEDKKVTDERLEKMFKRLDKNSDSALSAEEMNVTPKGKGKGKGKGGKKKGTSNKDAADTATEG